MHLDLLGHEFSEPMIAIHIFTSKLFSEMFV